jgi:hypothetical protein
MLSDRRVHDALVGSLDLSKSGQDQEALQLIDDVISEAINEGDDLSAFLLIDHAALLTHVGRDRSILKHYYEKYLTSSPEHPRALYGLADVAMEEGQTDDKIKGDLLDLVLERWPEAAE